MYRISKTTKPIATRNRSGYRTNSHNDFVNFGMAGTVVVVILDKIMMDSVKAAV